MMNRSKFSVALGLVIAASATAHAAILVPGGILSPVPTGTETGTLITTSTSPFTTGSTSGSAVSTVYREANNTLDFDFQVTNLSTSIDSDRSATLSDFATNGFSYTTDVVYVSGTGVAPTNATRGALNGGHVVGFTFLAPSQGGQGEISPGSSSDLLVVRTNATAFAVGSSGITDGAGATVVAFEPTGTPVPEPTSIGILGAMGLTLIRRRSAGR